MPCFLVAVPFWRSQDNLVYTDPTAWEAEPTSAWRNGKPRKKATKPCPRPDEHRAWAVDPDVLVAINADRIKLEPDTPKLEFYMFVQHEGEFVITTRHTAHAVVSIGQSYAVAHNFLKPRHVKNLYEGTEWVRRGASARTVISS